MMDADFGSIRAALACGSTHPDAAITETGQGAELAWGWGMLSLVPGRTFDWVVAVVVASATCAVGDLLLPAAAPHRTTAAMTSTGARRSPPPTPPKVAEAQVLRPAAETVTVDIANAPRDLIVVVDGVRKALPVRLPRAAQTHTFVLRTPGYLPNQVEIEATRDARLVLAMQRRRSARHSPALTPPPFPSTAETHPSATPSRLVQNPPAALPLPAPAPIREPPSTPTQTD
jgi:hypothetical protein